MKKKSLGKLFIAVAAMLSIVIASYGNHALATFRVPADYPTIQEAIDAAILAEDMDVVVSPGNYIENISFPAAMSFSVRSESGPEVTIIDGSGHPGVPVVSMTADALIPENGNDYSYPALIGFTITNGSALQGGGIYISNKGAVVANCIVSNNTSMTEGGGIYSATGFLNVINSTIKNNTAGNSGGGIASYGRWLETDNCTITGNIANSSGGGIATLHSSSEGGIYNSIISNNVATNGSGGGIASYGKWLGTDNSTITGNTAGSDGGGIAILDRSLGLGVFYNSTISNNDAIVAETADRPE